MSYTNKIKEKTSTSEDIQCYMNDLLKSKFNPLIIRSDNYEEESKINWVKKKDVDLAITELKKKINKYSPTLRRKDNLMVREQVSRLIDEVFE